MSKMKEPQLSEIENQLSNDPNLDLNTFQKIVKSLSKLPEEKLKLVIGQVGNFSEIATAYMNYLNESLKHSNELVVKYQESLTKQLEKEDNPEIRMQILNDLKDLHKGVNKQILIDKLQLDKVAMGGMAVIGAVVLALINKDNDSK
jgi:hypothetical protein